jgi:hypothetical protein
LNHQSGSVSQFASFVFFVEEKCETARSDDAEGATFDEAINKKNKKKVETKAWILPKWSNF